MFRSNYNDTRMRSSYILKDRVHHVSRRKLSQNYPNPFNPNTTIEYQVDRFGAVELTVYDILGRKIRTLLDAEQIPGRYRLQWDGLADDGTAAASGIYLYRLQAGTFSETRRLTLLK